MSPVRCGTATGARWSWTAGGCNYTLLAVMVCIGPCGAPFLLSKRDVCCSPFPHSAVWSCSLQVCLRTAAATH